MASQTQGSNLQAVSGDVATLQWNRKGRFLQLTNGLSVANKIKCGYALALSIGVLGTTKCGRTSTTLTINRVCPESREAAIAVVAVLYWFPLPHLKCRYFYSIFRWGLHETFLFKSSVYPKMLNSNFCDKASTKASPATGFPTISKVGL